MEDFITTKSKHVHTQIEDIAYAPEGEKAGPAQQVALRDREHPEMVRVLFKNGKELDFLTIRCHEHIICNCGINKMFNIINKLNGVRKPLIKSYGKPIKYTKLVTRIVQCSSKFTSKMFLDRYRVYGPVNQDIEIQINNMLRDIENCENVERTLTKRKREIRDFIKKHQDVINIYPLESYEDYRDVWGNK